jgi:NAD(P)-dependent dehydrogenase (short-subunit alcohol dehydrogenase family)
MNTQLFINKVAIVTGAASGIGLATAMRLGREGCRVVLADLNKVKLADAKTKVIAEGAPDALDIQCDVSKEDQVIYVVDQTLQHFGQLDIVVNNAGLMIFKPLEEHTYEDWIKILSVDLLGAFFFIKAAFKQMKKGGAIVNVSSIHAIETTPLVTSYAAAKSALLSLTRSAAIEGKTKGIRVNAVLPGAIETPMLRENPNIKAGLEVIQQNDVGRPEDIADAIAFLVSNNSKFVQGSSLRVDGGRLAVL